MDRGGIPVKGRLIVARRENVFIYHMGFHDDSCRRRKGHVLTVFYFGCGVFFLARPPPWLTADAMLGLGSVANLHKGSVLSRGFAGCWCRLSEPRVRVDEQRAEYIENLYWHSLSASPFYKKLKLHMYRDGNKSVFI